MQEVDFTLLLGLFFASIAIFIMSLLYVVMPLVKAQAAQKQLQAAGARVSAPDSRNARRSLRSWVVPSPASPLQDALVSRLSATTGAVFERSGTGELLLRGRSSRFWNVNHVDPFDFALAEVDLQDLSPGETKVAVRVDFSGYWHAILIVGLFTLWTCLCIWLTSRYRPGSLRLALILAALGVLFLCVRYFAQQQKTGGFFDALISQAIARPPTAPRPPA